METWELWFPEAAATGLLFARARIDPTDAVWVHAVPEVLSLTVRGADDRVLARGESLRREGPQLPMTRLTRAADAVLRTDRWPTEADLGSVILLAGGEAGRLVSWW